MWGVGRGCSVGCVGRGGECGVCREGWIVWGV